MTLQEHVTTNYARLMQQLGDLVVRLANHQANITNFQIELSNAKRDRDTLKATIVITRGGYSALGKNETDREYTLSDLCNRNADYRQADNEVNSLQNEIALTESDFKSLCRQYNAVAHQAQLTSSMLVTLAGPAGLSLANQPVPIPSPEPTRGAQPEDLGL